MSWSTSKLMVRLAPLNRFKPSSKIFYWPFQGNTSFVDLLWFFSFLCSLCLCERLFIWAMWSPAGKGLTSWLSFICGVKLWVCHFSIGILGQMWYLIVSIPDLCTLTYFLIYAMYHHKETIILKLTHFMLSRSEPNRRQASGTNQRM